MKGAKDKLILCGREGKWRGRMKENLWDSMRTLYLLNIKQPYPSRNCTMQGMHGWMDGWINRWYGWMIWKHNLFGRLSNIAIYLRVSVSLFFPKYLHLLASLCCSPFLFTPFYISLSHILYLSLPFSFSLSLSVNFRIWNYSANSPSSWLCVILRNMRRWVTGS